ncbi:MAG: DUF4175 family protein [Verrucomicrobiota bacterium]
MNTLLKKPAVKRQPRPAVSRGERRHVPKELPRGIARALNALASRVLYVAWAQGLLWLVAALCGLVILQGALDWLFDLPRLVRLLFAIADLAILGFILFRFGVRPWHRRLTPDEAALYAERHWPELRTGLISAVQLARKPNGSETIVKALLEKMAGNVAKLDLRLAVPWKQLTKLVCLTFILAGAAGGLIAVLAPKSLILLQRMALANVPLPTETIVAAVSRDFSIPVGQTIEISAKAVGVIPRSGRVEVTYEGRKPEMVTVTAKASSPDVFSLQIANVQQPLTYRFYLNDGRGESWKVALLHPPAVREIKFEVTPPAYTGMPPAQLSAGSLTLLAGSKLKLTGKATQALKGARVVLTGKEFSLEMKPEGAGRKDFSAQVAVPTEGLDGLWIELRNELDIVSQNNTVYAVQVLPDKPPEIEFANGQLEKASLVAEQKPRLRFDVRDDFTIQQIVLCVQQTNTLGEGEEPNPAKATQIPIPMSQPAAGVTLDFEWKEPGKNVDWREGNTFTYWIKAVDNNDVTGPGICHSPPRVWSVVSLQTKREELAEQLRKHAESIKDLSGAQENLRNQIGDILK